MSEIRFLSKKQTMSLLEIPKVIEGIRGVYSAKASGNTVVWPLICHDFIEGVADMDIKSGYVKDAGIHGLKMVNWFSTNVKKGLPDLSGIIMVVDSSTGMPIGILDGGYITCMRTGAAGAIGAKALAREDSENLMIMGAGNQAAFQIAASLFLMPNLKTVRIADPVNAENAKRFVSTIRTRLNEEFHGIYPDVEFIAADDLEKAVRRSDVIITVTPARKPLILKDWVKPGTHLSCIGADMPGKEEIEPAIFSGARVYADDKEQCINVGETEIPIKEGFISAKDIIGEIGEVLTGKVQGRLTEQDITIFDATGMALLDLVTGKAALDAAAEKNVGTLVEL